MTPLRATLIFFCDAVMPLRCCGACGGTGHTNGEQRAGPLGLTIGRYFATALTGIFFQSPS